MLPDIVTLLVVAPALNLDNFAAGVSIGLSSGPKLRWLAAGSFGVAAFIAVLVGALLGRRVGDAVASGGHLLGGGVLIALGTHSFLLARKSQYQGTAKYDARRVLVVACTVSTDTVVAGFAFGAGRMPLVAAALTIATVTVACTLVALRVGMRLRKLSGPVAGQAGGILLATAGAIVLIG